MASREVRWGARRGGACPRRAPWPQPRSLGVAAWRCRPSGFLSPTRLPACALLLTRAPAGYGRDLEAFASAHTVAEGVEAGSIAPDGVAATAAAMACGAAVGARRLRRRVGSAARVVRLVGTTTRSLAHLIFYVVTGRRLRESSTEGRPYGVAPFQGKRARAKGSRTQPSARAATTRARAAGGGRWGEGRGCVASRAACAFGLPVEVCEAVLGVSRRLRAATIRRPPSGFVGLFGFGAVCWRRGVCCCASVVGVPRANACCGHAGVALAARRAPSRVQSRRTAGTLGRGVTSRNE